MPNNFSCAIVDDEPKAIELLKECLKDLYTNIEIRGTYTTWNSALAVLREHQFDLLFLDVSMPGKTGMDLLSLLPGMKSEVIFITAHSEFALNAFRFFPTGYILKPIDDKELAVAVDKAMERIRHKRAALANVPLSVESKIGIPNNNGIDYLEINNILYLEATNKCTNIITRDGNLTSSYSLARFKNLVEKHTFFQVHRSFIVNLNCIKRYEANGSIFMLNGAEIPIAKNYRDDFLQHFHKVTRID